MLIALALTPFVIREIWMLIRNDYFSVMNWPLGALIYETYHWLMTPAGFYSLLIIGLGAATFVYFRRWRAVNHNKIRLS